MYRLIPSPLNMLLLFCAFTMVGCHCADRRASNAVVVPTAVETMTINGAVAKPGTKPLPTPLPTLRKALSAAGGVVPAKDVNGNDLEMLVRLERDQTVYYINATSVENNECGELFVKPGDTIEVLSWTQSDLFRGQKSGVSAKLTEPPSDTGNMVDVFNWYKLNSNDVSPTDEASFGKANSDYARAVALKSFATSYTANVPVDPGKLAEWGKQFLAVYTKSLEEYRSTFKAIEQDNDQLRSIYQLPFGSKNVSFEVVNEAGRMDLAKAPTRVDFGTDPVTVPKLDDYRDDTGLGTLAVLKLDRTVNGKASVFLLSVEVFSDVKKGTYTPVGTLLTNALIFDGDKITLTLPQDIPIVKASLVMAQLKKAAK
jgi:hypothetical protein